MPSEDKSGRLQVTCTLLLRRPALGGRRVVLRTLGCAARILRTGRKVCIHLHTLSVCKVCTPSYA
eukprot:366387-Chlamydomonas_euryale.AAC.14